MKKKNQPQTLEGFSQITVSTRTDHHFSSSTAICKIGQIWVLKKEQLPFFWRSKKPNRNPQAKMWSASAVVYNSKYYWDPLWWVLAVSGISRWLLAWVSLRHFCMTLSTSSLHGLCKQSITTKLAQLSQNSTISAMFITSSFLVVPILLCSFSVVLKRIMTL